MNIFMPTSIHLPERLLRAIERRARELGLSRNRVIVRALERDLARENEWPPEFFARFAPLAPADAQAVDDMVDAIRSNRGRKRAPEL